ncbi:Unknown protein, partial [Striga hermonthica]
ARAYEANRVSQGSTTRGSTNSRRSRKNLGILTLARATHERSTCERLRERPTRERMMHARERRAWHLEARASGGAHGVDVGWLARERGCCGRTGNVRALARAEDNSGWAANAHRRASEYEGWPDERATLGERGAIERAVIEQGASITVACAHAGRGKTRMTSLILIGLGKARTLDSTGLGKSAECWYTRGRSATKVILEETRNAAGSDAGSRVILQCVGETHAGRMQGDASDRRGPSPRGLRARGGDLEWGASKRIGVQAKQLGAGRARPNSRHCWGRGECLAILEQTSPPLGLGKCMGAATRREGSWPNKLGFVHDLTWTISRNISISISSSTWN